ncbi:hypothetical protein [Fulvimarina endophytica]|uniref:hypothetical protein n=1 Tax=Fulvimarina endophytica TaxID=2293836 RepID=UPI001313EEAB|nr:hypothetical protein [Fulvimarina endophytica]
MSKGDSERDARLQRELRANLKRRKDQARARTKPAGLMGSSEEEETADRPDAGTSDERT